MNGNKFDYLWIIEVGVQEETFYVTKDRKERKFTLREREKERERKMWEKQY
jgi:hypothetical protein